MDERAFRHNTLTVIRVEVDDSGFEGQVLLEVDLRALMQRHAKLKTPCLKYSHHFLNSTIKPSGVVHLRFTTIK